MPERPLTISITTGTVIKAVLILAGAWLLFELRSLVLDVIAAVVIGSAIEPGVARLTRKWIPRVLAVVIIYIALFAVFFSIFFFFLPTVFQDFAALLSSLPTYLDALNRMSAFDEFARILGVAPPADLSTAGLIEGVQGALGGSAVFGNAFTALASIFGGVFSFVLIIVLSFYFAVVNTGVDHFLTVVAPRAHHAYVLDLWRRSREKIGLWMQGQLLLAVIMGVLVYLGLTILGVKHALILAVVAAVFEIIPVFGPTLAAVPATLIGFADGGFTLGLLVIALYVILQQFENHLIYPLVVTRVVGVPPILVILALIVGAQLAGFLGILLSVPIAAIIQEFVRDVRDRRAFAGEPAV